MHLYCDGYKNFDQEEISQMDKKWLTVIWFPFNHFPIIIANFEAKFEKNIMILNEPMSF